jgi:hypothetical protein
MSPPPPSLSSPQESHLLISTGSLAVLDDDGDGDGDGDVPSSLPLPLPSPPQLR